MNKQLIFSSFQLNIVFCKAKIAKAHRHRTKINCLFCEREKEACRFSMVCNDMVIEGLCFSLWGKAPSRRRKGNFYYLHSFFMFQPHTPWCILFWSLNYGGWRSTMWIGSMMKYIFSILLTRECVCEKCLCACGCLLLSVYGCAWTGMCTDCCVSFWQ